MFKRLYWVWDRALARDAVLTRNQAPYALCWRGAQSMVVAAATSAATGPLILLCGPSGAGKSSIAVELAAARDLELLSQDGR